MTHLQGNQIGLVVAYILLNLVSVAVTGLRFYAVSIARRRDAVHGIFIDTLIDEGTVHGGIGLRLDQVSESQRAIALKTFFISQFFWPISVTSYRLAILHIHVQMFPSTAFCRVSLLCAMVVVFFFVASVATAASICWPARFTWDKTIHGVCANQDAAGLAAVSLNTVLDVLVVLLPLPWAWCPEMTAQEKIHVTVSFALVVSIFGVDLSRVIKLLNCRVDHDFTLCVLEELILTGSEMAIGIVIACLPTLGPIFCREYWSADPPSYELESGRRRSSSNIKPGLRQHQHPLRGSSTIYNSNNNHFPIMTSHPSRPADRHGHGHRHGQRHHHHHR
ncbi:Uncharacterized protein T310_5948, partial [Rasamsonia emersonii CBS 393.64]